MTERSVLRQSLRHQRNLIPLEYQQQSAASAAQHFSACPLFSVALSVAFYMAYDGEIDPAPLLEKAQQAGKDCYLPVLDPSGNSSLLFVKYSGVASLKKNRYGIWEPELVTENVILPQNLDWVVLPLLGFDRRGHRLGTGAGYYDRTFAFRCHIHGMHKPFLMGFAYEMQQIDSLEPQSWDVPLDGLLTEQKFSIFP